MLRGRIVAAAHDQLAGGTSVKDMLLASALAVVRSSDLPPGHHGGPLHPLAGLHAGTPSGTPPGPRRERDVDNAQSWNILGAARRCGVRVLAGTRSHLVQQ